MKTTFGRFALATKAALARKVNDSVKMVAWRNILVIFCVSGDSKSKGNAKSGCRVL